MRIWLIRKVNASFGIMLMVMTASITSRRMNASRLDKYCIGLRTQCLDGAGSMLRLTLPFTGESICDGTMELHVR